MHLQGRGVRIGGEVKPWRFSLDLESPRLKGELRVDGWSESEEMDAWFEKHAGEEVAVELEGMGGAVLIPRGVAIHESGHHNESGVKVEGYLAHLDETGLDLTPRRGYNRGKYGREAE
jgi:hypothetical protein